MESAHVCGSMLSRRCISSCCKESCNTQVWSGCHSMSWSLAVQWVRSMRGSADGVQDNKVMDDGSDGGVFSMWDCRACVSNVGHGGFDVLGPHASGRWCCCDAGGSWKKVASSARMWKEGRSKELGGKMLREGGSVGLPLLGMYLVMRSQFLCISSGRSHLKT